MHWCRIDVLGELRLAHDGVPLVVTPTAERLLAMMTVVHRDRRVRRSVVAERLWPDASPSRAASSLRSVLWRLPRLHGRPPVHGNATQLWLAEGVAVDLWEAEALARGLTAGDPTAYPVERLSLLDQDLLPGWHDEWLDVERESYRQTRLHALESGAGLLCREGRYGLALEAGLAAVRAEPLRESAHRRVIEVHLAEGNHAEALRQYARYRRLLAAELGLPPSEAIRGLVAHLLGRPVERAAAPGRRRA